MSMPVQPNAGAPPGPPSSVGPVEPGVETSPPLQLVQEVSQVTGAPPELVAAFLAFVAQHDPSGEVLKKVLSLPPQQLTELLQEFANSPAGQQAAGSPVQTRPGPEPPPPPEMSGPPPGPEMGGGPPPEMGGPPPGMGTPPGPTRAATEGDAPAPAPAAPAPTPKPKKVKQAPRVPDWEPAPLPKSKYGKTGPSYKTVIAHADEGADYYRDLFTAMQEWRDIYHGATDSTLKIDGKPADTYRGDRIVTRAQPITMASRIVGMSAPELNRIGIQVDPWADDDESKQAAQVVENFCRSFLDELYRLYGRRATYGDMQPPLPRKIAGLAAIEGGFGWRVMPDPEPASLSMPWQIEAVPMMELHPRPVATTRQVTCTLAEAYNYDEIRTLLPPPEEGDYLPYSEQTQVRLTTWTDEVWWCMTLDFPDKHLTRQLVERNGQTEYWIQKPVEHKLGRRIYIIPNPWDATPLGPSNADKVSRTRHLSRGIYAPIVETIRWVNKIVTALAKDVFKNVNPPKEWRLDPVMRAQYPGLFPEIDYDEAHEAGGNVVLGPNEGVKAIVNDLAATPSGQAFLQSMLGDLGDVAPPVMAGRGTAQSGFDRFQQSESAGALHIDPIITYLVGSLEYLFETILTDAVRLGTGKDRIIAALNYKVYAVRGSIKKAGYRAQMSPKDIKKAGPYVRVTFKKLSMTERMQLAQYNMMLVKDHFRSRATAMSEMGIDDIEREMAQMLAETTVQDPDVMKSLIRTALEQEAAQEEVGEDGVNWSRVTLNAYIEARQKETGGSPPAERGTPSPGAMPGQEAPSGSGPPPGMMGGS